MDKDMKKELIRYRRIEELKEKIKKMDESVNRIYNKESDKNAHRSFYGFWAMKNELQELEALTCE